MSFLVRDARPVDYAGIAQLLRDTYGGEGLVGPAYLPHLDDTAARADDTGAAVIVAVEPGTGDLLGTATLALSGAGYSSATTDGEATLRMLAVAKAARRRRIGTSLVAECVARARLDGATVLGLHTTDAMGPAHRLYAASGFVRTPELDTLARSGDMLRAYRRPLEPWPRIRVAEPGEHAATGELSVAAYVGGGLIPADDPYVEHLRDAKRRATEAELLVAVDPTDGLLGTVTYCPRGSTHREIGREDEGEFRMLAVSPQVHGRGIGEALVRSCLRRARAEGMRGIALSSSTTMHVAHRLYERLGFARDPHRDWRPVPTMSLLAYAREI
ncbi:MAG: GNAT family N-acetyltransferase [Actinopolymorphaceae bacterium]